MAGLVHDPCSSQWNQSIEAEIAAVSYKR